MRTVNIGVQGFEEIRSNNDFYIDKTQFIREWWENRDTVTLITRPRRFGKTLNLDMLRCFFSMSFQGRSDLFEGLDIWEEEKYRKLQGTYPVIFLSFADVKQRTYKGARESILRTICALFQRYRDQWYADDEDEKARYAFMDMDPVRASDAEAAKSLQTLSSYLEYRYGKKVLIFLDEYDTPLQEAYADHYWDEMTGFIRALFNATFKTNPSMERGLMTGISQVSKESIFSDLNNPAVITTTSRQYETAFGFTQEEVSMSLAEAGLEDYTQEVRKWYDGFTFGTHTDIYNPWSITNFLKYHEFDTYWADTSENKLVSSLLRKGSDSLKQAVLDLMSGKEYVTELDEKVIFNQLETSENSIWSLLLASGYLRVQRISYHPRTRRRIYHLVLTDFEVELMFESMVEGWFDQPENGYNDFVKALLRRDLEAMNVYMNRISEDMISFFDSGKQPSEESEPERFWHGFVLGLLVGLRDEGYEVTSNRESGFGRYDVIIAPLKVSERTRKAYVLEFKVQDVGKGEKTLEDTVRAALHQIEEKDYDRALLTRGFQKDQIQHYGFAFCGKKVLIG